MKRRSFIKYATYSGIACLTLPHLALASSLISEKELIGKGSPKLFGDGYQLRKEAHDAFLMMKGEALKENIDIEVVSSYRDFYHQKRIWSTKYKRFTKNGLTPKEAINQIIEYSTIPGTSRHHWGTDIDIIDGNSSYSGNVFATNKYENDGPFVKFKKWMDLNANRFGFYLVYTNDAKRKGFKYEPWHYSYKPLSKGYLDDYRNLNIAKILKQEQLVGSNQFNEAFIKRYSQQNILDINPELL